MHNGADAPATGSDLATFCNPGVHVFRLTGRFFEDELTCVCASPLESAPQNFSAACVMTDTSKGEWPAHHEVRSGSIVDRSR